MWHGCRFSIAANMEAFSEQYTVLIAAPPCSVTRELTRNLLRNGLKVSVAYSVQQAFARIDLHPYNVIVGHRRIDRDRPAAFGELVNFVRRRRPKAALVEVAGCPVPPEENPCDSSELRVRLVGDSSGPNSPAGEAVCRLIVAALSENDGTSTTDKSGAGKAVSS